MQRPLIPIATALLAALSCACSRHPSPPVAASATDSHAALVARAITQKIDACALIDQADADAILGKPARLSEHAPDDRHSAHCAYEGVDTSSGFSGFGVEIGSNADVKEAKMQFSIKKGLYSNMSLYTYKPVDGLADEAFIAVNKTPEGLDQGGLAALVAHQQILMLVKHDRSIDILVSYFGPEKSNVAIETLGRKLAAHFD